MTPNSSVWLLEGVFIRPDYDHTVDFKSAEEQFAFWHSFSKHHFNEVMYVRKTRQSIVIDRPIETLYAVNYMIFKNNNKCYYAFITDMEIAGKDSTYLYYELDVMQTYMFDYELLPSYVLREHQDRWTPDHKPVYSRTSENLDYGTEYVTETDFKVDMSPAWNIAKKEVSYFLVICKEHGAKVTSGTASEPTKIRDTPCPYCIYLVPHCPGQENINLYYGNEYVGNTTLNDFIDYMGRSDFGNFVQQIIHIPYLPLNRQGIRQEMTDGILKITLQAIGTAVGGLTMFNELGGTVLENLGENKVICKWKRIDYNPYITNTGEEVFDTQTKLLASMPATEGIENAYPTAEQWQAIKANPLTTERDKRFESKLLCYPYRYNVLTDNRNIPVIYKNEYIGNDKIELFYSMGIGFNTPFRYWLNSYRHDPEGRENCLTQVTPIESTIISDAYYSYMLENKNQLSANVTNAGVSGASNIGLGVLGGFLTGGIGGAIAGGIGAGVATGVNVANTVRSQNALKSDLRNLPDTIVNSNDCAMSLADGNLYLHFTRKKICCEFEEILADTFNMSGYTCQRVKKPNLKSRVRFNFIQTIGANLKSGIPQTDLQKIKNIFDKGITFWHYTAENFKPLDYSFENIERSLL